MSRLIEAPVPQTGTAGEPGPATPPAAKKLNIAELKQYFHIIARRIWLVALCFVVSLAITVVNLVRQVPLYRASTSLLLSQGLPLPEKVRQKDIEIIGDIMKTQQRILLSGLIRNRARELVNRPAEEINTKLRLVNAYPITDTAIIMITVDALDPVFASEFANAMADAYLDFKSEERMETSQSTVISLMQQANRLREDLKHEEDKVLAFKRENSSIALQERGNIAAQFLANLAFRAATYKTERMILQAQQPLIKESTDDVILQMLSSPVSPLLGVSQPPIALMSGGGSNSPPPVVVSRGPESLLERGIVEEPNWKTLKRQKIQLETKLADLRTRLRDAHPAIQDTIQRIKEADWGLDQELRSALQQYYTQLDALKVQEEAVTRAEREWEDDALEVSRKADEYSNLLREVNRLRSLYELVFSRLKEIDISVGIEPETIRQLEKAVPPSAPVTPRKMQSIFIAAIIGLGIGLGLVFGLEFIDDSIRYPEEVTREFNVPFFGVIPAANWDPEDLRSHMLSNIDQKSGLAEAYRNVRSALLFVADKEAVKTMVITSAVPKEGKTTTSLNLAVSLAQAGFRILLVDGDLRRGELHKFFGLEGGRGLSDVLMGQAKPDAVIQRTGIPNLDLVATGPFPPNPAELMLRDEFNAFVDYTKRTYDRVLFDCPPVMAVSEAGILASLVDGVILIVWAGNTSRKLCQLSMQLMRQRGAHVLGCVLNNLEFGRVGYYYYSTYYGYYDYDYRYDRVEGVRR